MPSLDALDRALLDGWQRDLPLSPRPFLHMGETLGIGEGEVIARLVRLRAAGAMSRVGATCRPNTAGASTLAAIAVPEERIEAVASVVGAEPGVNHSYLREHERNLWFVATGPDRGHVGRTLARIGRRTGLEVLDLPLVRAFNVDLGFPLFRGGRSPPPRPAGDPPTPQPGDGALLQALTEGLPLERNPWAALARQLGRGEADLIARIGALLAGGVIARLGVIVRHRALGWRSNAMVVWSLPPDEAGPAGLRLVAQPGITLCYQRRPVPGAWPYTLYAMIHGRSRAETLATLAAAGAATGLDAVPHEVLFSTRCFKQKGAMVFAPGESAA
jgi:DNA-binding Lrp family transcriptional regulator